MKDLHLDAAVDGLLTEWLPRQRWFGGKGRSITAAHVLSSATVDEDDDRRVVLTTIGVGYEGGEREVYSLLVGLTERELPERLAHGRLGAVDGTTLYDAVHDVDATRALLRRLGSGDHVDGLTFTNSSPLDTALAPRVMTAEQSNTSVVFGDTYILKLFRRLQPGANPDIEVTKALADAGCTAVAPPLAWLDGTVDGEVTTMGLLQPFLRGASEGWDMATASVRDLFAEGDLHADEVGGDFAGESARLGTATAEVHRLMAQVLPSRTVGPDESRATAAQLHERLEAAVLLVPELAPFADDLRRAYDLVAELPDDVPVQRVHGDLHLGQVLRTQDGWVLLDFEGEPARPLAERRALMSPLRDVAGMLRSFDYAGRHLLAEQHAGAGVDSQRAYRAHEWAERNRKAFCDGYARASGTDPREQPVLLRAFELDKAVYEVVYEARNRPTWLQVPLGSIERLVTGSNR